jgi:hypothetical protein
MYDDLRMKKYDKTRVTLNYQRIHHFIISPNWCGDLKRDLKGNDGDFVGVLGIGSV